MTEAELVRKIKIHVEKKYGIILHKYPGGAFGEVGVADLFGTIPPIGRAIYLEVKKPGYSLSDRVRRQNVWIEREASKGACCAMVTCIEDVDNLLKIAVDF